VQGRYQQISLPRFQRSLQRLRSSTSGLWYRPSERFMNTTLPAELFQLLDRLNDPDDLSASCSVGKPNRDIEAGCLHIGVLAK
jgi:hypothetical protein